MRNFHASNTLSIDTPLPRSTSRKMIFELSGSPIRVMGTLHLLPPGRLLPAWVRSAYDWSEAVFVEHSPAEFLKEARSGRVPTGAATSPAFWSLLEKVAGQPALPLSGLRRGAAVVMALGSRITGIAGADQALHDWSQADGKPFGYVEQAGPVLDALDAICEADWTAGIEAELSRPDSAAVQLQQFFDAWRKGRLDQIDVASRQGLFQVNAIRRTMLGERNAAWAARYTEPPVRSLIAVGAAHLVGPGNFLETLARASGKTVRRIV